MPILNRFRPAASVLAVGLLLAACAQGGDGAPSGTAAPTAAAPADLPALLAAADPEKGRVLFLQCRACHSLESGGANKVGPNLHGVFGRKAGLAPGFAYSEVISQSAIVWSDANLDHWLARPSDFLPGNRMVFVGIRTPEDRANLIAYLKRETGAK
ncbi:MAG: cytochrome c family protein [Gammaproteobacteria bacterium]